MQCSCLFMGVIPSSINIAILHFLDTTSKNLTFAVLEIVELLIFYAKLVRKFTVYLYTKCHTPNSIGSLVTTVKLKALCQM